KVRDPQPRPPPLENREPFAVYSWAPWVPQFGADRVRKWNAADATGRSVWRYSLRRCRLNSEAASWEVRGLAAVEQERQYWVPCPTHATRREWSHCQPSY